MIFNLQAEIARVNERKLHDPDYWKRVGLPMPARYLVDSISIPESIRRDVERDEDAPEPSLAMRLLGREICSDTRQYDERELRRAYNRTED